MSLQFEVQSASIIRINEVGSYATFSLVCSAFETGTGIRIGRDGVFGTGDKIGIQIILQRRCVELSGQLAVFIERGIGSARNLSF